jgi:hypothetical protein
MISETIDRFERNVADQLVQYEDRLRTSFEDRENYALLNLEVAVLKTSHIAISAVAIAVKLLTPRSTE